MSAYEAELEKARAVAIASIGKPGKFDGPTIADEIVEDAGLAILESLPASDGVDRDWLAALVKEKPALRSAMTGGGIKGREKIVALADMLLDDLESEIIEAAREKGFDIPPAMAP